MICSICSSHCSAMFSWIRLVSVRAWGWPCFWWFRVSDCWGALRSATFCDACRRGHKIRMADDGRWQFRSRGSRSGLIQPYFQPYFQHLPALNSTEWTVEIGRYWKILEDIGRSWKWVSRCLKNHYITYISKWAFPNPRWRLRGLQWCCPSTNAFPAITCRTADVVGHGIVNWIVNWIVYIFRLFRLFKLIQYSCLVRS